MTKRDSRTKAADLRSAFLRQVDEAARNALDVIGPDVTELETLVADGRMENILSAQIRNIIRRNGFFREEAVPEAAYAAGYDANPSLRQNLEDLSTELAVLRMRFPELATAKWHDGFYDGIKSGRLLLPPGAERWVCVPRQKVLGDTHAASVLRVCDTLDGVHGMYRLEKEFRDWHLTSGTLRRREADVTMIRRLERLQPRSQVLLMPMQFGQRHAGRSARRAVEAMACSEFAFSIFEVGLLMMMHVQWWRSEGGAHIYCASDLCDSPDNETGARRPMLKDYFSKVEVWTSPSIASSRCGTATGFLPEFSKGGRTEDISSSFDPDAVVC